MSGGPQTPRPQTPRTLAFAQLVVQTALRLLLWPFYIGKRIARYAKSGYRYDVDPRRLLCRPLRALSPEERRPEGRRVAFLVTGFVDLRVAREIVARLPRSEGSPVFGILDPKLLDGFEGDEARTPFPYDTLLSAGAWLLQVRPSTIVLQEQPRRITLVRLARVLGIRLVLVNGRVRAARGGWAAWQRKTLLGCYATLGLESPIFEAELRRALPGVEIVTTGIAKPLVVHPPAERRASLEAWMATERPLVAAGSVENEREAAFVLAAYAALRERTDAVLLLAPRWPSRAVAMAAQAGGVGRVSRRTEGVCPEGGTGADILVLDTIGELSYAYGRCVAAFLGGSLCGMGHNTIEPLAWGIGLAFGDRPGSSASAQAECQAAGVGEETATPEALAAYWAGFVLDPAVRAAQARRAEAFMGPRRNALDVAAGLVGVDRPGR